MSTDLHRYAVLVVHVCRDTAPIDLCRDTTPIDLCRDAAPIDLCRDVVLIDQHKCSVNLFVPEDAKDSAHCSRLKWPFDLCSTSPT